MFHLLDGVRKPSLGWEPSLHGPIVQAWCMLGHLIYNTLMEWDTLRRANQSSVLPLTIQLDGLKICFMVTVKWPWWWLWLFVERISEKSLIFTEFCHYANINTISCDCILYTISLSVIGAEVAEIFYQNVIKLGRMLKKPKIHYHSHFIGFTVRNTNLSVFRLSLSQSQLNSKN